LAKEDDCSISSSNDDNDDDEYDDQELMLELKKTHKRANEIAKEIWESPMIS
jgi:hypothetical protein